MSLSDFRIGGPAPVTEDEVAFEGPLTFKDGEVFVFDQSIAATGWVHLAHGPGGLDVIACGSLPIPPDGYPKGHAGTLLRADRLGLEVDGLLRRVPVTTVVHETPPVATGRMSRPESSLVSATVIRQVAQRHGHPVMMVSNQHSKKVLVRNGNATKPQWHKALDRLTWTGPKPTNEGQRDAMCLGLTYLLEKEDE